MFVCIGRERGREVSVCYSIGMGVVSPFIYYLFCVPNFPPLVKKQLRRE